MPECMTKTKTKILFKLSAFSIFLICYVLPSAVLGSLGAYLSMFLAVGLIVLYFLQHTINIKFVVFFILLFIYLFAISIFVQDITPLTLSLAFPLSLILFILVSKSNNRLELFNRVINLATIFAFVGLFCSLTGFLYAYIGGEPQLCIANADGRDNCLYLLTFSNTKIGSVIRPSFIFDEPGAFSFYLVTIVILRDLMGRSLKISFSILFLGMITFSLTHFLIFLIFILVKSFSSIRQFLSLIVFFISFFGVVFLNLNSTVIEQFDFFTKRVNTEQVTENNRTAQLDNFSKAFSQKIFFVGNLDCLSRPERRCVEHGDISSSPVTPMYRLGLFGLTIQAITHISLIFITLFRPRLFFCTISLSLILLQRPYFTNAQYSFLIYFVFFLIFISVSAMHSNDKVEVVS